MLTTRKNIAITLLLIGLSSVVGCTETSSRPDPKAADYYSRLGAGYLQKGRLDISKEYLEKALASKHRSSDAHHYYALLQEKLGDDAKASQHFTQAVRMNRKSNPELFNNYGSYLCRTGNYTAAVRAFDQALRDPLYRTKEFALSNAGICLKKQGNLAAAEDYLDRAVKTNPRFVKALYHLADVNFRQSKHNRAQAYLYQYNELAPDTPETLLLCYRINTALAETSQATRCSNQLQNRFPRSEEASQLI